MIFVNLPISPTALSVGESVKVNDITRDLQHSALSDLCAGLLRVALRHDIPQDHLSLITATVLPNRVDDLSGYIKFVESRNDL